MPATSQATDALALSATVVDEDGAPVAGATVAFELVGEGATLASSAVTGADGTATTSATPTEAGSYRATASYAGRSVEVVARPATGAEREEIVRRGRAIYHGYGSYVGRIHRRRMRVFVLEPAAPGPGAAG